MTKDNAPRFSQRGIKRMAAASPLMEMLCCVFASQYTRSNPTGPVSLGVAENSLMHSDLQQLFEKTLKLEQSDLTYGTSLKGSTRLFAAFCKLFADKFDPVYPVRPEQMVTGAGVGSLMDQLIALVCDEGDGVLLAAPYYSGFDKDLGCRNQVSVLPVDLSAYQDLGGADTLDAFEAKLASLGPTDPKPSAMILCNPHNPLGFCYTREAIIEYCKFAERHNLHLIVDEIYALSTYQNNDCHDAVSFTSILSIDVRKEADCDPSRVHLLYGASKDFCVNGFRIACLVSQFNKQLLDSFSAPALFIKVGSPSDALFSSLINSPTSLDWYLTTNKRRMSEAYTFAADWLQQNKIAYRPSYAGHFIFIDLSRFLPTHDYKTHQVLSTEKEREAALFLHLLESGVYIAPGNFYKYHKSGFFRLTFTVEPDIMQVGLDRLGSVLFAKQDKQPSFLHNGKRLSQLMGQMHVDELSKEIDQGMPCVC